MPSSQPLAAMDSNALDLTTNGLPKSSASKQAPKTLQEGGKYNPVQAPKVKRLEGDVNHASLPRGQGVPQLPARRPVPVPSLSTRPELSNGHLYPRFPGPRPAPQQHPSAAGPQPYPRGMQQPPRRLDGVEASTMNMLSQLDAWNPSPSGPSHHSTSAADLARAGASSSRQGAFGRPPNKIGVPLPSSAAPRPVAHHGLPSGLYPPSSSHLSSAPFTPPMDEATLMNGPLPAAIGPSISSEESQRMIRELCESQTDLGDLDDADMVGVQPDGMACKLLPHQRQGVHWMKGRERGKYRGGILADDMGLGKTVQMLTLIVSRTPAKVAADQEAHAAKEAGVGVVSPEEAAAKAKAHARKVAGKTATVHSMFKEHEAASVVMLDVDERKGAKTTLIIAPLGVTKQWEMEVREKTEKRLGLKVYLHHGPRRAETAADLMKYDVVITTYPTVQAEFAAFSLGRQKKGGDGSSDSESDVPRKNTPKAPKSAKKGGKPSALFDRDTVFWRIVLDEAQNIKNHRAKSSVACAALRSTFRWCLTGTPIQNNVDEFYSLLRFLQIRPFDNHTEFKEKIGQPLASGNQRKAEWAIKRLHVVLKATMLRRTKDGKLDDGKPIISLPKREVEIVSTEFDDPDEKAFYTALEKKVQVSLNKFVKQGGGVNYTSVLLLLLRLRQACDHPALVARSFATEASAIESGPSPSSSSSSSTKNKSSKSAATSTSTMAESDSEEEDEVLSQLTKGLGGLSVSMRRCELCGEGLPAVAGAGEDERGGGGGGERDKYCATCGADGPVGKGDGRVEGREHCSTKIRNMIKILDDVKRAGRGDKTIVFSQFTSMLDLVEPWLVQNKFKFVRYDGQMANKKREESLQRIRNDAETTVILISFRSGSVGLNLTSCNHVVLLDLWWNPALEDQAFDRAHRLGQVKDVKIYKLTIEGTVEQRILELQQKKRELARSALEGTKLGKNANKLSMADINALFAREQQ